MIKTPCRIVLIGYRGSGKSAVGRLLAEYLDRELLDTDLLIEKKAGSSIREIVAQKGWPFFRELEKEVIAKLNTGESSVIAAGGGSILAPENQVNLKINSLIFYLHADEETLASRIVADRITDARRPSLTGQSVTMEIGAVLKEREPVYREAANYIIDTSRKKIQDVVSEIIEILKPLAKCSVLAKVKEGEDLNRRNT